MQETAISTTRNTGKGKAMDTGERQRDWSRTTGTRKKKKRGTATDTSQERMLAPGARTAKPMPEHWKR